VSVTPQQFEQLKSRLSQTRKATASPVFENSCKPLANAHKIILGVDPSLRGTGFGVIQMGKPHPVVLEHGTLSCPAGWERSRCLAKISMSMRDIVAKYHPTACAIEGLFYAQNLQTALIMGEARGAALAAIAEYGLDIYEIAPRKMKQAIVGYGAAQKSAVAKIVQRMLHLPEPPAPDAADALALAISFAQESSRLGLTSPKKV
jgi:crossover junction endodeoxyribonuclease RuvC